MAHHVKYSAFALRLRGKPYFCAVSERFNVRAYGLLERSGRVLVSDEVIRGLSVTKFPGGGLEFGEGLHDCIVREFREELNLEVEVTAHFYTTDFFVASVFDSDSQVISVYYTVRPLRKEDEPSICDLARAEGVRQVRWIALDEISEKDLTLAIDRKVAGMLRSARIENIRC